MCVASPDKQLQLYVMYFERKNHNQIMLTRDINSIKVKTANNFKENFLKNVVGKQNTIQNQGIL